MPERIHTRVKIETIGPRRAKELLANPWPGQRPLRPSLVEKHARDMVHGNYRVTPDAVCIIDGMLGNAQHRLTAVVKTGLTQKFLVMYSNDPELYKVIDCGSKRTAADVLTGMPYNRLVPAVVKWLLAYKNKTIGKGSKSANNVVTQVDLVEFCEKRAAILQEACSEVYHDYVKTRILVPSIAAAVYVIAVDAECRDQARTFFQRLYTEGGGGVAGTLRNKLIANMGSRAKLPSGYLFGLTLKAFKAYCAGEHPKTLRWSSEESLPTL